MLTKDFECDKIVYVKRTRFTISIHNTINIKQTKKARYKILVTSNDMSKRGDSQCRSCKEVFNHSDLKIVQVKHYGLEKEEKVCPYCGSHTYGMIDYPVSEEELIYGKRSYRNSIHINSNKSKLIEEYGLNDEQELELYLNGYTYRGMISV